MKRLVRKAEQLDIFNRDEAVAYINGFVFSAETHAECVGLYLDEVDSDKDLDNYRQRPSESQLQQVEVDKFAFAHLLEREKEIDREGKVTLQAGIYIELSTLINVSVDEARDAIKQSFPQYDVFEFNGDINSIEDVTKIG